MDDGPDDERGIDSVDQFVNDLRDLWIKDGKRKFTALAQRTGVGKSTLHEAVTKQDHLPSERTVARMIDVLAPSEVESWVARRRDLAAPRVARSSAPPLDRDQATVRSRRSPSLLSRSAVFAGVVMVAVVAFWAGRFTAPGAQEASRPTVSDGSDPIEAGCVPDAGTMASTTVKGLGTLRLIYSTRCDAFWAKVERFDDLSIGNRVEVAVFERGSDGRRQDADEPDRTSAYTFVLRREDAITAVCASGAVWVDGSRRELPEAC